MSEKYDDEMNNLSNPFNAYLKYINQFSPLPSDEIFRLGIRNMRGDEEARQKLISHHLAFVVYIAKPYFKYYPNLDPMDIVQYGNEGLIKAVSMYDPEVGALTTYAEDWIRQRITRYLDTDYSDITTPVHIQTAVKKYNKILNKVELNLMEMPSDEELCQILNTTSDSLKLIKESYYTTVVSTNTEIGEDGEELELFIEDTNVEKPDEVINSIDNFELLIAIKNKLNPVRYYVLYMRCFDTVEHTLEDLANKIGVTRERVRQIEEKAKELVKPLFSNDYLKVQKILHDIKEKEKANFYKLNEKPITPSEIIKYLYLKRFFSGVSKNLLKDIFLHPYKLSTKEAATKYSMTEKEFRVALLKTKNKIEYILSTNKDDFSIFAADLRNTYGASIYDIDYDNAQDDFDYKSLLDRYGYLSFDEIKDLYGISFESLPQDSISLLKKFFSKCDYKIVDTTFIEREVNLAMYNCKNKSTRLSPSTLYKTYLRFKNEFNYEQQLLLECYFFNKKDKHFYDEHQHTTPKSIALNYLLIRLEKYHFGLNMLNNYQNLTKEIYEEILDKYEEVISDERKRLLNLIYGVGCDAMSLQDIVNTYNLDYIKTHDFLKHSRDYVLNLYLNRSSKKKIDKKIYGPYINNKTCELTDETRKVLSMYVIDELTYEEISLKTGLTKYRISNIVTEGIRKIDFYRFGIVKTPILYKKKIELFFKMGIVRFNELEKTIINLRFGEYLKVDQIYSLLNKKDIKCREEMESKYPVIKGSNGNTKAFINKTISKFNSAFNLFLVSDIQLTDDEIFEFVNKNPLESVLSENERLVLTFSMGIKNKENPNGKKYDINEIIEKMDITKDKYHHYKFNGIKKIKMSRAGLLDPPDIYMPLDKLEKRVRDRHIPISDKERMIINYFTKSNGYPKKSFKEIAEITGDNEGSVRRRYQRAIVNILKYEKHEISPQLDFELDFAPNLKYFKKSDQKFIIDYFSKGLSYDAIAKKYSLTMDKVISIFDAIYIRIKDMLENPKAKRFDYDYAETVLDKADLPFLGHKEVAKKIYKLAFSDESMENIPMTEIINRLNLDIDPRVANKLLIDFMISICKYRTGMKRNIFYNYEQIKDYYDRKKDTFPINKLKTYNVYLDRYMKNGSLVSTYVNDTIIFDLLKDSRSEFFELNKATRDEVLKILKNPKYKIDKRVRQSLMQIFDITERALLNGQDINHVLRMLHMLDLNLKMNNNNEKQRCLI